jgi:hypothetical protein
VNHLFEEKPDALIVRINTLSLDQEGVPTRVLVAINPRETPYSGLVRFAAAFPVRATTGRRPVIIRNLSGEVVPCRFTVDDMIPDARLPEDRLLWRMELEFYADSVPAKGWRAFASQFGFSPESRLDDAAYWKTQPPYAGEISVFETDCHDGDLPQNGYFADIPPVPAVTESVNANPVSS